MIQFSSITYSCPHPHPAFRAMSSPAVYTEPSRDKSSPSEQCPHPPYTQDKHSVQNTPRPVKNIQRRVLESNRNGHCPVRSEVCSQHLSPEPRRDSHDPVQLTDSSQHSGTEPRKDGHDRFQSQMLVNVQVQSPMSGMQKNNHRWSLEQPMVEL